jgi:hypothetical protein
MGSSTYVSRERKREQALLFADRYAIETGKKASIERAWRQIKGDKGTIAAALREFEEEAPDFLTVHNQYVRCFAAFDQASDETNTVFESAVSADEATREVSP